MVKYAGDLLIITQDGLMPMSQALQSTRTNQRVALTDKIQFAVSTAVSNYGANFGWQVLPFPKENMLLVNVPLTTTGSQQQYVMNMITRSWCNFTGWNAQCWELWQDEPYFGGNGYVGKAWNTLADNGANISADGLQAFNYFGAHGVNKQFTNMRPVITTDGSPSLSTKVNLDFDLSVPTAAASFSSSNAGLWGVGLWGTALWGGAMTTQRNWQGANGVGTCGAPHLLCVSQGINVQWQSTDLIWKAGGLL
jgi:hypothetical protein